MTRYAFWNDGDIQPILSNKNVKLPDGRTILALTKPMSDDDIYELVDVSDPIGRYQVAGETVVTKDGWRITRTVSAFDCTLQEALAIKLADLEARRWMAETGGMVFGGVFIPTDTTSAARIQGAGDKARRDPTFTKDWKLGRGVYQTLDNATLQALDDALVDHIDACFTCEQTHATAIMALTTVAEIAAYDIETGWPVNEVA